MTSLDACTSTTGASSPAADASAAETTSARDGGDDGAFAGDARGAGDASPTPSDATSADAAFDAPIAIDAGLPPTLGSPRVVAYVNVLCGFGVESAASECLSVPDPTVNVVGDAESAGTSPITHYVLSFLSFAGAAIQTDPGEIWVTGGSTTDFTLNPNLQSALVAAQAHGKKVMLSIGGEAGSTGFPSWASAAGSVAAMRSQLVAVQSAFEAANGLRLDGWDVDIELGGIYAAGSAKYTSTRDLIDAIPDGMIAAFVPQVGNGLCAAPVVGDALNPEQALGGQCQQPVSGDDSAWVLARLDQDCRRADGSPKLTYWGIQYYNAGTADCCGGGADDASNEASTAQHYKNFANGWPSSGDLSDAANPWHAYQWYPGPWPAFAGVGASRLVLGKPGCQGCAGSDYLDLAAMTALIASLDGKLTEPMGGVFFWDLGRLFGNTGPQCVSGACQPSWGGSDTLGNLASLASAMRALKTK